jgi:hypothetical protein
MKRKEIGIATLQYDQEGNLSAAELVPTMRVNLLPDLKELLSKSKAPDSQEAIRNDAEYVYAAWFNKMNEIELADRTQYKITAECVSCVKYHSGKISEAKIKFFFEEIN